MLRINAGTSPKYCDGLSRRSFVQLGVAGMAGVGLGDVWRARASTANESRSKKDTSAILIWLDGGPSHLDLYDLKPEAPSEIRGLWKPIPTNVPGIEISELFPKQFLAEREVVRTSSREFIGSVDCNTLLTQFPQLSTSVLIFHSAGSLVR